MIKKGDFYISKSFFCIEYKNIYRIIEKCDYGKKVKCESIEYGNKYIPVEYRIRFFPVKTFNWLKKGKFYHKIIFYYYKIMATYFWDRNYKK